MLDIESPLEMALAYADHGWVVFPLYSVENGVCNCWKAKQGKECGRDSGKHPRTSGGFKDATTDPEKIRHWLDMWPRSNIGIATGAVSGLTVIDVDPYHGGMETFEALKAKGVEFWQTAQVSTQRGYHLYHAYDGKVKNSLGKGIDVKSDGGYVVAPPSVGVYGVYVWQIAMEPQPL